MELSDLTTITITPEMVIEAEREEQERKIKVGKKTYPTANSSGNIVRRDLVGSLAHQAVEIAFDKAGVPYESTRAINYKTGDSYDILYEEDYIDVKGSSGLFNPKYFYNDSFLIYQHQLDDPKMDKITHFCFAKVDLTEKVIRIFGVISKYDFDKYATPRKLQYDNMEIKAFRLTPFRNYVYRTRR